MLIIEVTKNIETALKVYKSKVQKTRQIQKLREKQEFVKPSVRKRSQILKAEYVEKLKNGLN